MKRRHLYRRVLGTLPRYLPAILAGTLCVVGSRLLMVRAPLELGNALEALGASGGANIEGARSAAVWFLAISGGVAVLTFLMRVLLVGASRHMERDLKRQVFDHLETLPASYFDRNRTGDLISRLTSDVEAVRWVFGPGFMYVGGTLVLFPMVLISMANISPALTGLAVIPLVGIMVVVRGLAPRIMQRTRAVQRQLGVLSAEAQESFAGARVVRAYAMEPHEVQAFGAENEALVKETLGLARVRATMQAGLYLLGGAAEAIVLIYGGHLVMEGELALGSLIPLLSYVGLLIWPMISVGWVVSAIQRAAAAMGRINEVLDTPSEQPVRVEGGDFTPPARGAISIRGLSYAYPGTDRYALRDLTLEIPAGSTLAVVGPVGSGKTTLLRLLARLYEPPSGTIHLDGTDVCAIPLEILRDAFAAVPQDAFLFSTTIRANLAYASSAPLTDARADAIVEVAGLERDVKLFPRGLETLVGERGLMLSGGQKQRVTLARALLRESPVLLLDDCLSAVDTVTEARILDALRIEMRRRTVLVVAQRLSTVRDADQILVLDEGRVVQTGSHEQLLAEGGWYARTWKRQRLQAAVEDEA